MKAPNRGDAGNSRFKTMKFLFAIALIIVSNAIGFAQ
jgi:hypothetical protein